MEAFMIFYLTSFVCSDVAASTVYESSHCHDGSEEAGVTSYPFFQTRIPNGDSVQHPCKKDTIWQGVGHFLSTGTGYRNAFGLAFAAANYTWTEDLCRADTDGDGQTNGEELGDPDCIWSPGQTPSRQTDITHPGICDPWDSAYCMGQTVPPPLYSYQQEWMAVECKQTDFECDAMNEDDVKTLDLRLSPTPVPSDISTYMCQIFNFTDAETGDFHLIGSKPIIDDSAVLHYMTLFGCEDDQEVKDGPFECGLSPSEKCQDHITQWKFATQGDCLYNGTGIPMGTNGYKIVALLVHYSNPAEISGLVDNSGLTVYYTDKLKPYDEGIFHVGATYNNLPTRESVTAVSACTGPCTQSYIVGPVYVTSITYSMHYNGLSITTLLQRSDGNLSSLVDDKFYTFDHPTTIELSSPIELFPGDEVIQICEFDTTFMTGSDHEEMCCTDLSYYPKENILVPYCFSDSGFSYCDEESYQGCDNLFAYGDQYFLENTDLYRNITADCVPHADCTDQCRSTLTYLKQTDPCMQGEVFDFLQNRLFQSSEAGLNLLVIIYGCDEDN